MCVKVYVCPFNEGKRVYVFYLLMKENACMCVKECTCVLLMKENACMCVSFNEGKCVYVCV